MSYHEGSNLEEQNGICKEKCTSFPNCNPCGELHELRLWVEAFDIMLSSGNVYSYDYNAAVTELKKQGFLLSKSIPTALS